MKAMREAYGEALAELGTVNPNVVVLDADVSSSTKSAMFEEACPERFFNVGIAEGNMAGIAAGLAAAGKIPFINSFAFLLALRAADPIRSLIAYNRLNVKICGAYAGFSDSNDGASHQSVEDVAVMRALPHMTVVVPADEAAARQAVFQAADYAGPVYLRLNRAEVPKVYETCDFTIGKGNVLKNGADITIAANGRMVFTAVEAAKVLGADGIDACVIDLHTVKPLDEELLLSCAEKTGAVVTAEEHSVVGGLGSAVAGALAGKLPVPLETVGIADCFGETGDYDALLVKFGLDVTGIVRAACRAMGRKERAALR